MKQLVIFYSYSNKTREIATELAKRENADIIEVKEVKKRSTINAYVLGSFAAMKQKKANIEAFNTDLSSYDKITIAMPLWAGFPAPAMNNIIDLLPSGKDVEVIITSGSGDSSKSADKTKELINQKRCKVISYKDIKTYAKS